MSKIKELVEKQEFIKNSDLDFLYRELNETN